MGCVEPLNHAIRLWMARRRQAVSDAHLSTADIEDMLARGPFTLTGKSVGELSPVVRQDSL